MKRALASALFNSIHVTALYDVVNKRIEDLNLSQIMVYMIDTVPASALPHLAEQFHISGFEGYRFASTEKMKRDFIKAAIRLHKIDGTPFSIKKSLEYAGYPGAIIQEGVSDYYNGEHNYDGTITHGSEGWAKFIVFIPVDDPLSVPAGVATMLTNIINTHKPGRCLLESINYVQK